MNINNTPPRLTWPEAQAVLEQHIQSLVAQNDDMIEACIERARKFRVKSRHEDDRSHAIAMVGKAKMCRLQNRMLLATLNTMMRGV